MIEIDQLTKHYGSLKAVDNLSFHADPGTVLGFLGPNGAGKSTTMKMIAGFLSPTSGTVKVCGFDVERDPISAKSRMGYLPEGAPSYGEMTVAQFLDFIGNVRGLTGAARKQRIGAMVERLNLARVLSQSIETLSKGFRRRVGLAQALLHDPEILILDEPTDGLDPNQKHEVRQLIRDIAPQKTVIISTHILEEVDALCQRAIIIARGRILADATPAELEARSRFHNAVRLTTPALDEALEAIRQLPEVATVDVERDAGRLTAIPKADRSPFLAISELVRARGWDVAELSVETGRLDDVFRQITTGDAREVSS